MHKLHVIMELGAGREGLWMTKISGGGKNKARKMQIISERQMDRERRTENRWKVGGWMIICLSSGVTLPCW